MYVCSVIISTCRDAQDNVISEGKAIAGIVQQSINIYLRYNNIGDDPAFGSVLTFSLPERLSYLRVDRSSSPEVSYTVAHYLVRALQM